MVQRTAKRYRRYSKEDKLTLMKEHNAWERFMKGEDPEIIAAELGVSRATFYRWCEELGLTTEKGATPLDVVRQKEDELRIKRALEDVDLVIDIGSPIVREHNDFIHYLLKHKGMSAYDIATQMIEWFERKKEIEDRIHMMAEEIDKLKIKNENLLAYTAPNMRYMLKAYLCQRFYSKITKAVMGEVLTPHLGLLLYERFKETLNLIDNKTPLQTMNEIRGD